MYVGLSEKDQKDIYNKGRSLGEQMIERFPKSVPIKFWYGANLGRWADVHGFVKSATSGIAGKLREACKQIIELDPKYQGGGGYRILAQVHFYSPNIPFLMGWPSDDRALELIEKAMAIAPEHPTNRMLYAQILLEFDRDEDAKKQLQYILEMEPRPTHLVEDRYVKHRSHQLLKEHF
jgi:tetratricopeptide (TPR) repeat protein